MPASLGTPTLRVSSGIHDSVTVESPLASRIRCASPTDRLQNGHTGTSTTASTCSASMLSAIAGALFRSSSVVSRR